MYNYQCFIWVFNFRLVIIIIFYSVYSVVFIFLWFIKYIFNVKNSYLLKGFDIYIFGYFVGYFDLNYYDFL